MTIRYRVELSEAERTELQTMLKGGKHAARRFTRAVNGRPETVLSLSRPVSGEPNPSSVSASTCCGASTARTHGLGGCCGAVTAGRGLGRAGVAWGGAGDGDLWGGGTACAGLLSSWACVGWDCAGGDCAGAGAA